MTHPTITEINVYPLKSGAPVTLDAATVEPRGLEHDRRWMLVDDDGQTITAREVPTLVHVRATVETSGLTLSAPGTSTLQVPPVDAADGSTRKAFVFDVPVQGVGYPPEVDSWISSYLGTTCHLVHMASTCVRDVRAENGGRPGDEVSFADECPLLLISQGSLRDLNARAPRPVSMAQFRPNLVVSDLGVAYPEDDWKKIRVGEVEFDCAQACKRCVFTTIDPETATRDADQEPLRTLSTYRRRGAGGPAFGVHLIPRLRAQGPGIVSRGDTVEVLE